MSEATNPAWEKELREACKWWANVLREGARHDAGDAGINAMAAWAQKGSEPPSEEQLAAFEQALFERMTEHWTKYNQPGSFTRRATYHFTIDTDYSPCKPMCQAAYDAGIFSGPHQDIVRFPCKTVMWLAPGKVTVRYGYAADTEVVWQDKETEQ